MKKPVGKKNTSVAKACSMTGYGKASRSAAICSLEVEVRTLNNRHLDLNIRLPREYSEFELKIRELAAAAFKRGRVDIFVNRTALTRNKAKVTFNSALYAQFTKIFTEQAKKLKILEEEYLQEALIEILSRKEVLEVSQDDKIDPSKEKKLFFDLLEQAFSKVKLSRQEEGAKLIKDIQKRISALEFCLAAVNWTSAKSQIKIRENLLRKINELEVQVLDPGRLEQETALLVMRSDITEETVRLSSHLDALKKTIGGIDGKRLEFILQEILREFNTIGSKSNDIAITNAVIEAKTNIERIREQSQNIE